MGLIARMSPVIVVIQEPNAAEGVLFAPLCHRALLQHSLSYTGKEMEIVSVLQRPHNQHQPIERACRRGGAFSCLVCRSLTARHPLSLKGPLWCNITKRIPGTEASFQFLKRAAKMVRYFIIAYCHGKLQTHTDTLSIWARFVELMIMRHSCGPIVLYSRVIPDSQQAQLPLLKVYSRPLLIFSLTQCLI